MINFEEIFNEQELAIFENISAESTNIEELKKIGNVLITKEEKDGYITETITFKSFDNTVSFTRFNSYKIKDEKAEKVAELNELIETCVRNEQYENAAKYKALRDAYCQSGDTIK